MTTLLHSVMFLVSLTAAPTNAMAAWASGGGELFRDAHNPWFIQNTKRVHYCVELGEGFGVAAPIAKRLVRDGLNFWVNEFANNLASKSTEMLQTRGYVGTQEFIEDPCNDQTDLRIQLGVLSQEQLARLGDTNRFAAITIRTDYDEVNLRGRGFLYVAPESGPLRPNAVNFPRSPWTTRSNDVLRKVIMHELGHIFGMGHFGSTGLMSEDYVERLLRAVDDPNLRADENEPQVFRFKRSKSYLACDQPEPIDSDRLRRRFFDIPPQLKCVRFEIEGHERLMVYGLTSREATSATLLGSSEGRLQCGGGMPDAFFPIRVFLTQKQNYFKDVAPDQLYTQKYGWPNLSIETCNVRYRSLSRGVTRELLVRLDFEMPVISGVFEGQAIRNVMFPELRP